jgi:hypothetical protein
MASKRDYSKERAYNKARTQYRSECHKARRRLGLKKGDGLEAHHSRPVGKGGKITGPFKAIPKRKNRSFKRNRRGGIE